MEKKALEIESHILRSSTREEALNNAILAVEIYMKAIKLASSESERERLKLKCMQLLTRAEEIKKIDNWITSGCSHKLPNKKVLRAPLSTRTLSTREQLILLQGSKLNDSVFPPWKYEPGDQSFLNVTNETQYLDISKLKLSDKQEKIFAGWKRPSEAFGLRRVDDGIDLATIEPTMSTTSVIDLVQDVTADCSVVASLCAVAARVGSELEQLLQAIFYPYDKIRHIPAISPNGQYIFRLHFNGCFRKVIVDDHLPTSYSSRTLYVVDRRNPGLLWPALLEKAYLKVRGGYDFPGSNSGTDLWVLTGWIPEHIFLQSVEIETEELWRRLFESYISGDVMVTLGTGRLSQQEEEGHGLAGQHDYAVVNMKEVDGQQFLMVKNPWCDGTIWKGPGALSPREEIGKGKKAMGTSTQMTERIDLATGSFWITFDQVIQNFKSLYINWNPGLFRYREDYHFSWSIPLGGSPACFTRNPQYSVQSRQHGSVWILLNRHFRTEESSVISSSKSLKSPRNPLGFIALYVFDTNGARVHLSDGAKLRGPFVDSPQTLLQLDMPAMKRYTVVVVQQDLPLPQYAFSLSAYSQDPVDVGPAWSSCPYSQLFTGSWTSHTAGGNVSSPSYPSNPQFTITVTATTKIVLILETPQQELLVHVKMVWSGGQRISNVIKKDIITDSGDYRRGCAFAEVSNVPMGHYSIICSTFDQGQTGNFDLRVETTAPCQIEFIANETAGRLSFTLPPLFLRNSVDRMLAPIKASRLTSIRVIARYGKYSTPVRSPLKISLERSQGPNKTVLGTSFDGKFSDAVAGFRIGDIDIGPQTATVEDIWLVVERFGGIDTTEEVHVEVLTDAPIEMGPWGTGNG